jgi:spore coat protein A, manganese oxidase
MFRNQTRLFYYRIKNNLSNLKNTIQNHKQTKKPTGEITKLDPKKIPKYVNQLVRPPVYKPLVVKEHSKKDKMDNVKQKHCYTVDISEFKEQILPEGFPQTTVWGYGGLVKDPKSGKVKYSRSAPGATFEAIRGIPVTVKWINRLKNKHLFAVDPTLHWANPNNMPMEPPKPWPKFPPGFPKAQAPVPTVTHLHGGEVPSTFDGHPEAWFTYNHKHGPAYKTTLYTYPNEQQPTTLWYHDHTLGITRLNVYAGLAGFYLLREDKNYKKNCMSSDKKLKLPSGDFEIPLVIQDRMFNTDGSLRFNNEGINPEIHPYWVPEFFGDTIMVNGKVWPNLDVERRQYRFRVLNGSNARFYQLKMSNGMKFIQIGTDGGFLPKPVERTSLLLAPGERADVLVDFSMITPGTSLQLLNAAKAPFPAGDDPDPDTVGQIMQFTVPSNASKPILPAILPDLLNCIPELKPNVPKRILTLNEVMGLNGPTSVLLNGQKWSAPITEKPRVGATEEWWIVNLTADTHPIHLHLVQFQLLNRQNINSDDYRMNWEELNGMPPLNQPTNELPVEPYLVDGPIEPEDNEKGWKDTVRMNPNQVTRIRVRFAPQDIPSNDVKPGENKYSFDPSLGPGYVWHCHILDHEDNEMMRPYKVRK